MLTVSWNARGSAPETTLPRASYPYVIARIGSPRNRG